MNLSAWDRRAEALKSELGLVLRQSEDFDEDTAASLKKKSKKIAIWQKKVEMALTHVSAASLNHHFLSPQEKTLLHWAREYTQKVQSFYREYLTLFNSFLWSKLVQMRSISFTATKGFNLANKGPFARVRFHQQELLRTKAELERSLKKMQEKKDQLQDRYEALGIGIDNHQSFAPNRIPEPHESELVKDLVLAQMRLRAPAGSEATLSAAKNIVSLTLARFPVQKHLPRRVRQNNLGRWETGPRPKPNQGKRR